MAGFAQLGIAMGALGIVVALLGLFPDVTGIPTGQGFGVVQFVAVLIGFALLISGALIYVKATFFMHKIANLAQQIGIRLALTGLVVSGIAGLADFLGFGSHGLREIGGVLINEIVLGPWQAIGIIGGFLVSSSGVVLYALANRPE